MTTTKKISPLDFDEALQNAKKLSKIDIFKILKDLSEKIKRLKKQLKGQGQ